MAKNKSNISISIYRILYIFVAAVLVLSIYYYSFIYATPNGIEKYAHHIGYLAPKNIDFSGDFERCGDSLPLGFYHSGAPHVYRNTKYAFKKHIQQNFKNKGYSDHGFLNLRFLINCKGEVGNMEINELDTEYQRTDLNDEMVTQLIQLSVKKENWNTFEKDAYMYLIYKIENGKVVEILP